MPITIYPTTLKYKNGSTFQSADCLRGEQGIQGIPGDPTELIDDTAGTGDTDKTWSADKVSKIVPAVTSADNGKFLRVVEGEWTAATVASASGGSY